MVYHQTNYIKYRLNRIECFIKCIEALGNETTAVRENLSDIKKTDLKLQQSLNEDITRFENTIEEELMKVAMDIKYKTNESFLQLSKPLRILETELRERTEGVIRMHLEDNDQRISEFANILVESNRDDSVNVDDLK